MNSLTPRIVLRVLSRIIGFGLAGALGMALVGACEGAITGPFYGVLAQIMERSSLTNPIPGAGMGGVFIAICAKIAAYIAAAVGAGSGALFFAVAGALSSITRRPAVVLWTTFKSAARGTVLGILVGLIVGPLNVAVWNYLCRTTGFLQGRSIAGFFGEQSAVAGCYWGVIGGFILGNLAGVILGVRREVSKQRGEVYAAS